MGKVLKFTGITRLDHDPDQVLEGALGKLETCLVVGYDKEGREFFASSSADGGVCLWLLKKAEIALLNASTRLEDE